MTWDLNRINETLADMDALDVVRWSVARSGEAVICSTNFRPQEAVILHLVTQVMPEMKILWADTGYALPETYRFAQRLISHLNLQMHITNPRMTRPRWEALHGEAPLVDEEEAHEAFTEHVKIEPFHRGLAELKPRIWLTAIRQDQTDFRAGLNVASEGPGGVLRVSPVFRWTDTDMESYIAEHQLPDEPVYFDPTKADARRECGLHLPGTDQEPS